MRNRFSPIFSHLFLSKSLTNATSMNRISSIRFYKIYRVIISRTVFSIRRARRAFSHFFPFFLSLFPSSWSTPSALEHWMGYYVNSILYLLWEKHRLIVFSPVFITSFITNLLLPLFSFSFARGLICFFPRLCDVARNKGTLKTPFTLYLLTLVEERPRFPYLPLIQKLTCYIFMFV